MSDFTRALTLVLQAEGGYVNDPVDPGGETYRGITRRDHPGWPGWQIIAEHGHTPEPPELGLAVAGLYRVAYWDPIGGDAIADQAVAEELFDTAVNQGVGTAALLFQRALNCLNRNGQSWADVPEDADVGPRTLTALAACLKAGDGAMLVRVLNRLQACRYIELMRKNPALERFARGWLLRT